MLTLIIDVLVTSGLLYALATALPGVRLKSFGAALAHPADRAHRLEPEPDRALGAHPPGR